MTVPNGQGYEGEFRDGEFHGQGVYTWPDGTRIEGRWFYGGQYIGGVNESGQPHGYGVMSWWYDGERYVGEWGGVGGWEARRVRVGHFAHVQRCRWTSARARGHDVEKRIRQ